MWMERERHVLQIQPRPTPSGGKIPCGRFVSFYSQCSPGCPAHVGTADHVAFEAYGGVLDLKSDEYSNPCTVCNDFAEAIVARLKRPR
ncbi:hypothetical protein Lesp02_77530 [Lentzea sp. NBRC 105346]|nr:hypothetical protein Lesp02_77530 [Lentzea sp. NBRC 105346]